MKVKRTETTEKDFKPVTIEITFENPKEINIMYHRMNIHFTAIQTYYRDEGKKAIITWKESETGKLFDMLNLLAKENDIKLFEN